MSVFDGSLILVFAEVGQKAKGTTSIFNLDKSHFQFVSLSNSFRIITFNSPISNSQSNKSTEHRSITKCCRDSTDFFISRGFWNRLKNNVTVTYVICGCFKRIQSQHEKFTTECKATIARQYSTWRPLYHSYSNRYSAVQLFLFLTFVKTKNANTKKQLSKDTAYEHHHHHHHHHQHVHYSA